ncbi:MULTISPECIES: hypothetical protein [unclassified Chromobacterium]|uniref:hypothetical protein n=1 Tax=unclassified Chromobacterium TaxID=2641838 RepID=UPI001F30C9EC|nr:MULTISPECIES: hypothetical protein [unclassified Chromobacterium]MCP1291096.1 hypothetical protein [Chromobacterium sp. S0633]UJB32691.1 hypothetical protein HQN78_17535 [Chromobacterium sp. Beijing]
MNAQATPVLLQLQDLLQELRANAQGRPELEALCRKLDRRYLEVDEGLTRSVLRFHSATQSLQALMSLLLSCPDTKTLNGEQIAALLEPVRQELQAAHKLICKVM